MNLAVRTIVDPKSTLAAIQSAIREVDKDQPVYQIQTIDELIICCYPSLCFDDPDSLRSRWSR